MRLQSNVIESIAYDEKNHVLIARFRDTGETVMYDEVPQDIYDSLIFAESISGFFRAHIEGRFPRHHH